MLIAVAMGGAGRPGAVTGSPAPENPLHAQLLAQRHGARGGTGRRALRGSGTQANIGVIRGKVTAVDEASGSVTVQTEGGSFTATFAADTLKRTKVGDEVIVALEIINTRIGAIAGPVSRVEPESGNVTVQTASGSLTLNFPSYAVRDLRQGDPVVVKLDLTDLGPAPNGPTPETTPPPR